MKSNKHWNKRIGIGVAALLVLLLVAGAALYREGQLPGLEQVGGKLGLTGNRNAIAAKSDLPDLRICVASDVHYIAPTLTDNGKYFKDLINQADGKDMLHIEELLDTFLEQVETDAPEYLILSGDLSFNGARESHEALAAKLSALENTGTEVLVMPGNHDIESRMAARFEGNQYTFVENVDEAAFAEIYADFGYDEALARDPASLSYTYELGEGLWALVVDTNTAAAPGRLTEETRSWVEDRLKEASRQCIQVLAVSHQNVLPHNSLFMDGYLIYGHDSLQELYEKYGVLLNLSGHMHCQHIAESEKGLSEILTSALPVSPCQYGVIDLEPHGLTYHTEEVTYEHRKDAADLMWRLSRRAFERENTGDGTETPEEEKALEEAANFFARVNTAYFAGRTDQIEWNEEAFERIRQGFSMNGIYLQTVYDDGFQDMTTWEKTW